MQNGGDRKIKSILALILAGEGIFILPFVLTRIFRPSVLIAFEVSNFELGKAFSIYGLVALISYFFGGPVADRFSARSLICSSLLLTGGAGMLLAFNMNVSWLMYTYAFWGFSTIFLFWAAMIKATREWGGEHFQGRAYGILEGGRGLTAALIGSFALLIFSSFAANEVMSGSGKEGYQRVMLSTSCIVIGIGLIAFWMLPKHIQKEDNRKEIPGVKDVLETLKMPAVWIQAIIIISAYVAYKSTDDFSLYAFDVLGYSEVDSAFVGNVAIWLRPVFAVIAGFLADRYSGIRILSLCFIMIAATSLLIFSGLLSSSFSILAINFLAMLMGIYGLRGIYFSVMKDAKIPIKSTGIAVGIMSVVGYTPDIFMSPFMGFLLDRFPGPLGHQFVFLTVACFSILGLISVLQLKRIIL